MAQPGSDAGDTYDGLYESSSIILMNLQQQSVDLSSVASDIEKAIGENITHQLVFTSPIKVKHLIRAGMVDFDLIKQILEYKYGFTDIGFEDGEEARTKTISGYWPISFYWSFADFENKNYTLSNRIIEPYYRIDKDLDFVEEAYRQSTDGMEPFEGRGKTEERHLHGLDPMQLLKVPRAAGVFGPITNKNNVMYPVKWR